MQVEETEFQSIFRSCIIEYSFFQVQEMMENGI